MRRALDEFAAPPVPPSPPLALHADARRYGVSRLDSDRYARDAVPQAQPRQPGGWRLTLALCVGISGATILCFVALALYRCIWPVQLPPPAARRLPRRPAAAGGIQLRRREERRGAEAEESEGKVYVEARRPAFIAYTHPDEVADSS